MPKLGVRLKERIARSSFFFGAVLFHLALFLMLVGYVVWQAPPKETTTASFDPAPLPKPVQVAQAPSRASVSPPSISERIDLQANSDWTLNMPKALSSQDIIPGSGPGGLPGQLPGELPGRPNINSDPSFDPHGPRVDLPGVAKTFGHWPVPGRPGFMKFPIYIAKYADGDWDCNIYLHDGLPASGSLPNLMAKIHEWSHGELDGRQIKVVDLASPEILNNPPPFIFFTGHKDFHLTAAEIENLRKYLLIGGAIWGDSAFAGDGSRFDVAFHREMKYVLPDKDLQFEDMPMNHDVFTSKSHFTIDQVPAGMNRRADPIQCINLDGKLAVLYTPNDYSDMMTMLLQPGLDDREAQMDGWNHWEPNHPLYTNGFFVWHAASYFRNYEPSSSMAAYKLSMNVLVYLLHRYDDELELTP
jgi:hypothetical protein